MSEAPDRKGAWPGEPDPSAYGWTWPILQPAIYVMGPDASQAKDTAGKVAGAVRRQAGKLGSLALGAAITAAAFYVVPRLIDHLREGDTVDLETEE